MIVNLHIERLVLDGVAVAPHEGPRVGEAVTAELARLIAAGGIVEHLTVDRTTPRLGTDPILRPASKADSLGAQIGRSVYGAIGQ